MGLKRSMPFGAWTCLGFILVLGFCWCTTPSYSQTKGESAASPVLWGVPWPEEGKANYGYPILPGVKTFPIYHATRLTGVYSHHSQIGHFHNTFFASWSNQEWDEDAPGQRVLCSLSSNGRNWKSPF